jgi:acetyl esterase/lipase
MKKYFRWILLVLLVSLCGASVYGFAWIRQYQAVLEEEPEVELVPDFADVTYCTMEGVPLQMDLYLPDAAQEGPAQVLLYVHGGSFTGGDKRKGGGIIDIPAMTARGYAVAAANYRLMPEHPFPAAVLDARCAIRFLRAEASAYGLRADEIGIWGGSAGGNLAAMVGLTNGDPAFEAGEHLDQSSQVDGVVMMFGPTDLTARMGWLQRMLLRRAFGTDDPESDLLRRASPVQYVTGDEPPFLILHGDQDSAVPVDQARAFYEKMTGLGGEAELVIVENANHNFKPTGGPIRPSRAEISEQMGAFFDGVFAGQDE